MYDPQGRVIIHNNNDISCDILNLNYTFLKEYHLWDIRERGKSYIVENHLDRVLLFAQGRFVAADARTFNAEEQGFSWCTSEPSYISGISYLVFDEEFYVQKNFAQYDFFVIVHFANPILLGLA